MSNPAILRTVPTSGALFSKPHGRATVETSGDSFTAIVEGVETAYSSGASFTVPVGVLSFRVVPDSTEMTLSIGEDEPSFGDAYRDSIEFSRPANTTAYAAKDAISDSASAPNLDTFKLALGREGVQFGSGYIVKARLMTNQSGNTARYRIHLYSTLAAVPNDNAQLALLWADRANRIGTIDLPAMSTEGTGSDAAYTASASVRIPFVTASGSRDIYAVIETLDAFTPASGQAFFLELQADSN